MGHDFSLRLVDLTRPPRHAAAQTASPRLTSHVTDGTLNSASNRAGTAKRFVGTKSRHFTRHLTCCPLFLRLNAFLATAQRRWASKLLARCRPARRAVWGSDSVKWPTAAARERVHIVLSVTVCVTAELPVDES